MIFELSRCPKCGRPGFIFLFRKRKRKEVKKVRVHHIKSDCQVWIEELYSTPEGMMLRDVSDYGF